MTIEWHKLLLNASGHEMVKNNWINLDLMGVANMREGERYACMLKTWHNP
jgi:hypothetical protein